MSESNNIQQARDVLAKWREGATAGPWKAISFGHGGQFTQIVQPWEHQPGADFNRFDNLDIDLADIRESKGDATLIVGTAGNPDLWDAIDAQLAYAQTVLPNPYPEIVVWSQTIAAAIIAADERMSL